jgi:hypothetical protein
MTLPRGCTGKRDGFLVSLALAIMAQTIRDLVGEGDSATLAGRLATKAVSQGRCLVPWILA